MSGQTSEIKLEGMPKDGFRSREEDSRYARAMSRISSTEDRDFFPEGRCKELLAPKVGPKSPEKEDRSESKKEPAKPIRE